VADPRDIIIRPVITERSMQDMAAGKYTFAVDPRANKHQIKQAIQQIFEVDVVRVNTMQMLGKRRRMGAFSGRRPSWKKAVVTLKEGQTIAFFEGLV